MILATDLATDRLALEPLRISHAAEMVGVLSDPSLYSFIGGKPPNEAELVARYTRQVAGEGWLNWIVRLPGGEAIGTVQATLRLSEAELAWVVSSAFQGHGYATEATGAVIGWLRERAIELFVAHIYPDHEASNAVARRLGFEPTDQLKGGEVRWELRMRCHN